MQTDTQRIIEYTQLAILFFLLLSLVGIVVLSIVKNAIKVYFFKLNRHKQYWKKKLKDFEGIKTILIDDTPKNLKETIGFAMAISEYTPKDFKSYRQLCLLIRQHSIDAKLTKAYKSTYLRFRKAFFLSLLSDLPCNRQQEFCKNIVQKTKNEQFYHLGIYTLSKSIINSKEAQELIEILSQTAPLHHIGRHYYQLLFFIIFKQLNPMEQTKTIKWVLESDLSDVMLINITEALGRFRDKNMKPLLLMMYKTHFNNAEIVSATIRSLFLCRIEECSLINEVVERQELPIKITTAKFGIDICPSKKLFIKLLKFFFDKNYYVRQNIFQSCQRHHIPKEMIITLVESHFPQKLSDRFFIDMMEIYDFKKRTSK